MFPFCFRLKVGQRIIEVNGQSLLGASHQEAVNALRAAGNSLHILICDGYNKDEQQQQQLRAIENTETAEERAEKVGEHFLFSFFSACIWLSVSF